MAGDTPSEAVRAFVAPLQAALVCFADGKVTADTAGLGIEGVLTVNRGNAFRLNGSVSVYLEASMRYKVVSAAGRQGPYKVTTQGWIYHLLGNRRRGLATRRKRPADAVDVLL